MSKGIIATIISKSIVIIAKEISIIIVVPDRAQISVSYKYIIRKF
jgi:hypothetical protein